MYVSLFVEGTGTSITADCGRRNRRVRWKLHTAEILVARACMQSVGKVTCSPEATSQMQSMPTVASEHDSARQKSDVDSHVATVAFLTATVVSPSVF